jgi:hypothetical protein
VALIRALGGGYNAPKMPEQVPAKSS